MVSDSQKTHPDLSCPRANRPFDLRFPKLVLFFSRSHKVIAFIVHLHAGVLSVSQNHTAEQMVLFLPFGFPSKPPETWMFVVFSPTKNRGPRSRLFWAPPPPFSTFSPRELLRAVCVTSGSALEPSALERSARFRALRGFEHPDPQGVQFRAMRAALEELAEKVQWTLAPAGWRWLKILAAPKNTGNFQNGLPWARWNGPKPAVCPSCLILSHTHLRAGASRRFWSIPLTRATNFGSYRVLSHGHLELVQF